MAFMKVATDKKDKKRAKREKGAIARPGLWVRKGHYKRAVFEGRKDKRGRVYMKTTGGLRKHDLMNNKRGKIVSKKMHAKGTRLWNSVLKPFYEARKKKAEELGLTGFLKAKKNGTDSEKQLYLAMLNVKTQYYLRKADQAAEEAHKIAPEVSLLPRTPSELTPARDSAQESIAETEPSLPTDARVFVHGLTTGEGQKVNGCQGVICGWSPAMQRYRVKMDKAFDDTQLFQLKAENLTVVQAKDAQ